MDPQLTPPPGGQARDPKKFPAPRPVDINDYFDVVMYVLAFI
jgi:hypothetical protein